MLCTAIFLEWQLMAANETTRWLRQGENLQRSTLIELFFDLAFVFALTQLSVTLAAHLTWGSAYRITAGHHGDLVDLVGDAWATDLYAQRAGLRALVVALMFGVILLASACPGGLRQARSGLRGVLCGAPDVADLVLLIATWDHPLRKRPARVLIWFAVSGVFWLMGAFVRDDGTVRCGQWPSASSTSPPTSAGPRPGSAAPRCPNGTWSRSTLPSGTGRSSSSASAT